MSLKLLLQLRIAFMLWVLLMMLFQWWNLPGSSDQASDDNEPRQYLRPIEQVAPHRGSGNSHFHTFNEIPCNGRFPGC